MDNTKHIVKSFDEDLQKLNDLIVRMASLTETQFDNAFKAINTYDHVLAQKTVEDDRQINELEKQLYEFAVKMLALRQPMGPDLRNIIAALKISSDVERIADYASNAAQRCMDIEKTELVDELIQELAHIGSKAHTMFQNVIKAFVEKDVERAVAVWLSDAKLDMLYNDFFKKLLKLLEDETNNINAITHLMFISKSIERWGDHTQNIAEIIFYSHRGKNLEVEKVLKRDIDIDII